MNHIKCAGLYDNKYLDVNRHNGKMSFLDYYSIQDAEKRFREIFTWTACTD